MASILDGLSWGGDGQPGLLDSLPPWLREAFGGPPQQQQPQAGPGMQPQVPMPQPRPQQFAPQGMPQQAPQQMPPGGLPPRTPFGEAPKVDGLGNRMYEALGGFLGNDGLIGGGAAAIKTLATGEVTNPYALQKRQQLETYAALQRDFGMTEPQARMAMQNPKVMEALIPMIAPKFEEFKQEQSFGRRNPATGQIDIQGTVPKFEHVQPGTTAGYATPPVPGAGPSGGGGFQPFMQGGMKNDDISGIRKEITALPEVKRYSEAAPIFRSMTQSHNVNTSAADLDFVYGVAKIFDPDSVVHEGEMKLVGKAQSLPEDIKGFIQSVAIGNARLTPEARARILDVSRIRMNELKAATDQRLAPYHGIADRNKINKEDILPQLPQLPTAPTAAAVPGDPGMTPIVNTKSLTPTQRQLMDTAPEKTIVRVDGKRVIKQNGEWVPAQ